MSFEPHQFLPMNSSIILFECKASHLVYINAGHCLTGFLTHIVGYEKIFVILYLNVFYSHHVFGEKSSESHDFIISLHILLNCHIRQQFCLVLCIKLLIFGGVFKLFFSLCKLLLHKTAHFWVFFQIIFFPCVNRFCIKLLIFGFFFHIIFFPCANGFCIKLLIYMYTNRFFFTLLFFPCPNSKCLIEMLCKHLCSLALNFNNMT